jgi:hypothetical protein
MAALYGRLRGERGEVTRTAGREITATLQTWDGRVSVTLWKDGVFVVEVAPLDGYAEAVCRGNVNGAERRT